MNTLAYAVSDSATMLRRNLRHLQRYPSLTLMLIGLPVIFLLMFVYVFGGALGAGIGNASSGRAEYVNYVAPGILLMTIASAAQGTAITVAMDMTEGIIARFRTMAIFRPSVLTGHVLGSMIQTGLSLAVVIGVALLIGFDPNAGPVEWIAAISVLAMEQPSHAPDAPAFPRQWIRPHRLDASRHTVVRRVPTLHTHDRNTAGAPPACPDWQQRRHCSRLVRRHNARELPVGARGIQPRSLALRRAGSRLLPEADRSRVTRRLR
jgi:hypothetical protein